MLIEEKYMGTATLVGGDSTFAVSIEIENVSLLKGDVEGKEAETIESIQVKTFLLFEEGNVRISQSSSISIWSDSLYDLNDLSLCMAHFAGKDDTTEEIADMQQDFSYSYRAIWLLSKDLFGCELLLSAKNTSRFAGVRFVDILFYSEKQDPVQCTIVRLEASPDAVKRFAEELHQVHEDLQTLMSNSIT